MTGKQERTKKHTTATSTDQDILPRQYDKIQFLFELDNGSYYRCPCNVNAIQEGTEESSLRLKPSLDW